MEVVAIGTGILALIVGLAAIWLDIKIMRHLHPHHKMIRDLHQHHFGDTIESLAPGHEDCHGPVYRKPTEWRR